MRTRESKRLVVWMSINGRTFTYTEYATNYQGVENPVSICCNLTREEMTRKIRRYPKSTSIMYVGTDPLV